MTLTNLESIVPVAATDALGVLDYVESLPRDCAVMAEFEGAGAVLVDAGAICWASAVGAPAQQLMEALRLQHSPPMSRPFLEEVLRDSRRSKVPMAEALLATGQVSEQGLREALRRQILQAVALLSTAPLRPPRITRMADVRYDRRFCFEPWEVLVGLCGRREPALRALAQRRLRELANLGGSTVAFVCPVIGGSPRLLAARNDGSLTARGLNDVATVAREAFEGPGEAQVRQLMWNPAETLVCWREERICWAAVCAESDADFLMESLCAPSVMGSAGA